MKAIKFLLAIALVAAMASCSEDLPNPGSQQYPEPDGIFANSDIVLAQGNADLLLQEANANNVNCVLATVTDLKNFPDGYTLSIDAQVSGTQDFSEYTTIATEIQESNVTVNPDILNGAIQEVITKAPDKLPVYIRCLAYAERENTRMLLGGKDHFFGPYTYNVTPLNPTVVIEQEYYLVGKFCDWDITKAVKFTNTVAGANAYDNPQFSIVVNVTEEQAAAGYKWMVIPASTYAAKNFSAGAFGTRADESGMAGILIDATKADEAAGVISVSGPMQITVDMRAKTYGVNYALNVLWAFWKNNDAMGLYSENYINYTGVAVFRAAARFGQEPNTSGIMFKQDPDAEAYEEEGVYTGRLTSASGGRDIKVSKDATLYWCDLNLVALTYSISAINSISVVGAGNDWNEKEAPELTPSADLKVWTGKDIQIGKDGDMSFKLNCNHAWTLDFGGASDPVVAGNEQSWNLAFKGGNMIANGEGKYDVEVNFGTVPYTVKLTKK